MNREFHSSTDSFPWRISKEIINQIQYFTHGIRWWFIYRFVSIWISIHRITRQSDDFIIRFRFDFIWLFINSNCIDPLIIRINQDVRDYISFVSWIRIYWRIRLYNLCFLSWYLKIIITLKSRFKEYRADNMWDIMFPYTVEDLNLISKKKIEFMNSSSILIWYWNFYHPRLPNIVVQLKKLMKRNK